MNKCTAYVKMWFLGLLLVTCVAGCAENAQEAVPVVNPATSVSFAVTPVLASIPVTGTQQFTAIETFSDGSTIDRTAVSTWSSVNVPLGGAAVATISSALPTKGLATGNVAGQSDITATFGARTATAVRLTVSSATSVSFAVTPALASIPVAGTQQYTSIETFSDGTTINRTAASTWSSANVPLGGATVATVSSVLPTKGLATGNVAGQSDITATFGARTATAVRLTVTATGSGLAPGAVPLGTAAPFGSFGGTAGMTNTGTLTVVGGDIGTIATSTASITGFHDTAGDIYTESPANIGAVTGKIYTCTNSTTGPTSAGPNAAACAIATQARLDAEAAYLALAAKPAGANPGGNLAGLTLAPGTYTAPAGSFLIEGGDLTLDAGGNPNAVWVFKMATTLTVGGPGAAAPQSIILAGGAQAKNIFWQVGSFATINAAGGGTMVGTIISQAGASFSTAGNVQIVTLRGRVLSLGASVTLVDTVIELPAP